MNQRLQSIELQGFKTFATSQRFEFPGKITAIVGPNGSGKSNIADSIRWVLGEQSYSLLRAKKTEDMIFSGSQDRPRAGMAAATIVFNNEDQFLPIDYSEVSITRRAYRDGQNEYLLNGQKVRLRDITELMSKTGLSEMTYTVIGQGLVDVALALKPDERRKLFEEAAGIGLYRHRKEEALRRLETTRKNLDRVLDILTEIKPRLRSLERQTARFETYERLRADLQLLLREWYGYHWHKKQQDLRHVRNDYHDQETRLVTLRQKSDAVQAKVEKTRTLLQDKRRQLEKAHRELADRHQELEASNRNAAILDERKHALIRQQQDLEVDMANVEEELASLRSQQDQIQQDLVNTERDFEDAVCALKKIKAQFERISQEKEALETALKDHRQSRVSQETEKIQTEAHLQEISRRLESDLNEKAKLDQSHEELTQESKAVEGIIADILSKKSAFEKQLEMQKAKVQSAEDKLSNNMADQDRIESKRSKLETQYARLEAQIAVLEQAEAALSGYSEGSKALIAASRKGKLPRNIIPLSQHLIIEKEFETALSAALGELADLILTHQGDEDVVLRYLKRVDIHRVTLLWKASELKIPNNQAQIRRIDGCLGSAGDLIELDPEIKNRVGSLFANIFIVENEHAAQKVLPLLSHGQKVVTLDGVVFQADGILIAGQTVAGKRISRTREKREMHANINSLEAQIAALDKEKQKLEQLHRSLKNEVLSVQGDVDRVSADLMNTQAKLQKKREIKRRISEQLSWHSQRRADLEGNIKTTRQSMASDSEKIEVLDSQIQTAVDEENELQRKIANIPMFDIQREVNHWETSVRVAENALSAVRERHQDHQDRIQKVSGRLKTYTERLVSIEESLSALSEEEERLQATIESLNQTIAQIEENKIHPLDHDTQEIEQSYTAIQKMEAHSHQQVVIAERQYTQLQLELSRRDDQLKNIQSRIEDDFGLVSFDYEQKIDGPTPLPFEEKIIQSLPNVTELSEGLEQQIKQLKSQIRRIGAINPAAKKEYDEVKQRFTFLSDQVNDLESASKDLTDVIDELDLLMERDFIKTFKAVNQEFSAYFSRLFNGGEAKLSFSDDENPVEGGVDIEARLPGRRRQVLALLSGGERSLTAVALIFALLKISPTPFCVLDEVDAMLDESNVGRFIDLLKGLSDKTQFILITHNRNTVQAADVIYGITMSRDSSSQVISLKLEDVDETYLD